MKERKKVQDVKEIEIATQDTNQGADDRFTEVSIRKRERRNTSPKMNGSKTSPKPMKQEYIQSKKHTEITHLHRQKWRKRTILASAQTHRFYKLVKIRIEPYTNRNSL